jgi:hypothetical protein
MSADERVIVALFGRWEGTKSTQLAVGVEELAAPSEYLVSIGLMTDIPHDAIVGGVIHVVQGYSYLCGSQTGCEVAGIDRQLLDNILTEFPAYFRQLVNRQFPEVFRKIYFIE